MPYFSVIIPVYNRPDEVRDLLLSLSRQSCRDFEVLIVLGAGDLDNQVPEIEKILKEKYCNS